MTHSTKRVSSLATQRSLSCSYLGGAERFTLAHVRHLSHHVLSQRQVLCGYNRFCRWRQNVARVRARHHLCAIDTMRPSFSLYLNKVALLDAQHFRGLIQPHNYHAPGKGRGEPGSEGGREGGRKGRRERTAAVCLPWLPIARARRRALCTLLFLHWTRLQ